MKWVGNIRYPAETMRDLSDKEWLESLWAEHGRDKVHIGPSQAGGGQDAEHWESRGMVGIYMQEVDLMPR